MDHIKQLQDEIRVLETEKKAIAEELAKLQAEKISFLRRQEQVDQSLYQKGVTLFHVHEILRVANIQFSRLRGKEGLTIDDLSELNKWIGRVKSEDGLKDIIGALNELQKYQPASIKTNLYALVQKIIIGGAYKQGRK
jgi:hypothetical protein